MRFRIDRGAGVLAIALVSGAAAAAPEPDEAHATMSSPTVVVAKPGSPGAKPQVDFAQFMTFFDKLFPVQPEPDPARLTLARQSVDAMWPDGAYGKMMTGMMGSMIDRVMQLKKSDFAGLDPKLAKGKASDADKSVHDQELAKDPYFDQRVAAIRAVMTDEMVKVSVVVDPKIRDGLARAMARRFDAKQLADINAFFATPSGHALASQSMQLWVDPDMIRSLFGSLPEMMKLMPEITQKIKAADDKFPKPPKAVAATAPAAPAPAKPAKAHKH